MRATEKTYYNIKRLHLVFAASSLALLLVTVSMLAVDHYRPWKEYQRTFRDRVEPWMTEARIGQHQTEEFRAREQKLAAALEAAGGAVPPPELIERFRAEVARDAARRDADPPDVSEVQHAYNALAAEPTAAALAALLDRLKGFVAAAVLRQQNAERRLRFRRAEFDEARSYYEAAVGEGLPQEKLDRLQRKVEDIRQEVDRLAADEQAASAHQEAIEGILGEVTVAEDAARKTLADHRATLQRLGRTLDRQRPSGGKRLLRAPLIDALGRPLAIDQIWLPELTIDYNFRRVARFDRCVTCHQAVDKTQPGQPSQPAYRSPEQLTVELATPAEAPQAADSATNQGEDQLPGGKRLASLEDIYGLVLAEQGILDPGAATIQRVLPKTPAADAQLLAGDVIVKIGDREPVDRAAVQEHLLEEVEWGRPITLEIRRGLPLPYASHPRLDLFVGSLSPHPMTEFGCTICHDGQGSATDFTWASHTPNQPGQGAGWRKQHGWHRNPHWDLPMMPRRFAQSRCLKCHHAVTDLEPSRRFADPPAAKLLAGYQLVRRRGCFGCHEIKGFDDTGRSIGPDMRLEPDDSAAEDSRPGTLRRVGPSLREIGSKVDAVFLADWIADPARFRPSTRMPRFYGLHEHLDGKSLADARRFEAVEIRATVEYLLAAGRPVEPLAVPAGVTEPPSAERGKRLFEIHGCLACHRHADFPKGQAVQGADLTNVGSKFTTEAGARWLASWIRDPIHHSPRTLMPSPLLEPIPPAAVDAESGAADETPEAKMTDPAGDVAAYLLSCQGWQPAEPPKFTDADLDELVLSHLKRVFPGGLAEKYAKDGIPQSVADRVQGDAAELLGGITRQKKLRYVGRRTIRKRGCYGCHDVAGCEAALPIGPALTDWGRKQESLLAFEQINRFIKAAVPAAAEQSSAARLAAAGTAAPDPDHGFYTQALLAHRREGFIWQKLRAPRSFDFKKAQNKDYNQWLTMGRFAFTDQEREAIITFVLGLVAEPPAEKYVYRPDVRRQAIVEGRKVLDKYACAECHTLKMQRWTFEFDPDEFEGPPATEGYDFLEPRFSRQQIAASLWTENRGLGSAEVAGMPQVDARGELAFVDEDEDDDGNAAYQYAFTLWEPAAVNGQVAAVGGADLLIWGSRISDGRLLRTRLDPAYWGSRLTRIRPPLGGAFARLLFPTVVAEARAAGNAAAGTEAWGWVPPPLVDEGAKARSAWLHGYLLDPTPIRPAAVLRMPRYNFSPVEAGKLVDYFAAVSGVDFPYSSDPRSRSTILGGPGDERPRRLDEAMRMVGDTTTYCAKCHLVGDFSPGGEIRTVLAPNLDRVGRRLRPQYVRRWLANPRSVLPYTAMPVNFPATGEPIDAQRFPGNSVEQLDAVMDLLLNYDEYFRSRTSIRQLVPPE